VDLLPSLPKTFDARERVTISEFCAFHNLRARLEAELTDEEASK
jgi:hypothetical protein